MGDDVATITRKGCAAHTHARTHRDTSARSAHAAHTCTRACTHTHTRAVRMHAGTLADPLSLVSKLQLRGKCTADKADRLFGLMHEA